MSHVFMLVTYAAIVSGFFALLWRRSPLQQGKLFLQIFLGMVGGGLALAWLMFFFPAGPPSPIP